MRLALKNLASLPFLLTMRFHVGKHTRNHSPLEGGVARRRIGKFGLQRNIVCKDGSEKTRRSKNTRLTPLKGGIAEASWLCCLLLSASTLTSALPLMAQTIYFDDSSPNVMKLGNTSFYEIGLRMSNGSIAYLIDKSSGQSLTHGSRYEQLWGAVFPSAPVNYIGGASYHSTAKNKFSYQWNETAETLTLFYTPDSSTPQRVTAEVMITASPEAYFDLRLHLKNEWGYTLDYALFPSDLVFKEAEVETALLPILPGIVLESSFFSQGRSYGARYPGGGVFADYVFIQHRNGALALYSLYNDGPVPIVDFGYVHDDQFIAQSTFLTHNFRIALAHGEEWTGPVVRMRVSESLPKTIAAFRDDNGLARFPSVAQKHGADFQRAAQSPLLKADFVQLAGPPFNLPKFTAYDSLLAQLPSPALLHPVAFQPGGFDNNYPDFLPPNPDFGTKEELRALFQKAQALGMLAMPYINPTWWDDESPTLKNLPPPLMINDIAVLDKNGNLVYERYGPNGGYVVSPCAPFVQERVDRLLREMAEDLPSDFVFEDQIGARPVGSDFAAPLTYMQGWLEHTRAHAAKRLATEQGYDRLLETGIAFHGSALLNDRRGELDQWWGAGNWRYYPLISLMAHDKVLLYQHDLAEETMTHDKATLIWNLAFGYMLSYDLFTGQMEAPAWRELAAIFQKHVASRYAGESMTDYFNLEQEVTQSNFASVTVVTNWSASASYAIASHMLPPQGMVVTSNDGKLTAGIFTRFNNADLSFGEHYLVVKESMQSDGIQVWQPGGFNTSLAITRPSLWAEPSAIHVYAVGQDSVLEVAKTVAATTISFEWRRSVAGFVIDHYLLTSEGGNQVDDTSSELPAAFELFQSTPNPFHAMTQVAFALAKACRVKLEVFNLQGRQVATLADGHFNAGRHEVTFAARNLPTGIYLYRVQIGRFEQSRKLIVMPSR